MSRAAAREEKDKLDDEVVIAMVVPELNAWLASGQR